MKKTTADPDRCKGCGPASNGNISLVDGYCEDCRTVAVHDGYTRQQLSDAFDGVKNRENWKNPIDTTFYMLPGPTRDAYVALVTSAINFYTGGGVQVFELHRDLLGDGRIVGHTCGIQIKAPGYFALIGA